MALGLPVVATDLGGIPEMVEHDITGLLVPPGDVPALQAAILRLFDDPARARAMGASGRERARARFSRAAYVEAHARWIDGLLGLPDDAHDMGSSAHVAVLEPHAGV
jgi:glycosyltransferase involved in cell wall biosynthesis